MKKEERNDSAEIKVRLRHVMENISVNIFFLYSRIGNPDVI